MSLTETTAQEFKEWAPGPPSRLEKIVREALNRMVLMAIFGAITFLASAAGYNTYLICWLMVTLAVLTAFNIRALNTLIVGAVLGCLAYIAMYRTVASIWEYAANLISHPAASIITKPSWWPF